MIGELGRTTGISKFGYDILSWVGRLLSGKIAKIVVYDKGRVIGGNSYDSPGQWWGSQEASTQYKDQIY